MLEQFAETLKDKWGKSDLTIKSYLSDMSHFATMVTQLCGTCQIDETTIGLFFNAIKDQGFKKSTIVRRLASVRAYVKFLKEKGLVDQDENPTQDVSVERVDLEVDIQYLDSEQIAILLSMENEDGRTWITWRDNAIIQLISSTGLKVGEVSGLDLNKIALVDAVEGSYVTVKRHGVEMRIPIDITTRDAIEHYLCLSFAARKIEFPVLFLNKHGNRLSDRSIRRKISLHAIKKGIKSKVTPRILRHSFAMDNMRKKSESADIQRMMGYRSMTGIKRYQKVLDKELALSE